MKILIMCEGPNELAVINLLLDHDKLIFKRADLLDLVAFHARQLATSTAVKMALNRYPNNDVKILRIGDAQSESIKITPNYRSKILSVEKYCTKRELEVLLIIAETLWTDYLKVKSKTKPKIFAKQNIKFNKKRYDNSSVFHKEYFECKGITALTDSIKQYNSLAKHNHEKTEFFLSDLLKE